MSKASQNGIEKLQNESRYNNEKALFSNLTKQKKARSY